MNHRREPLGIPGTSCRAPIKARVCEDVDTLDIFDWCAASPTPDTPMIRFGGVHGHAAWFTALPRRPKKVQRKLERHPQGICPEDAVPGDTVHDGSTGELRPGYWLCDVTAGEINGSEIVPLYQKVVFGRFCPISTKRRAQLSGVRSWPIDLRFSIFGRDNKTAVRSASANVSYPSRNASILQRLLGLGSTLLLLAMGAMRRSWRLQTATRIRRQT